jgi:hypothetical protein
VGLDVLFHFVRCLVLAAFVDLMFEQLHRFRRFFGGDDPALRILVQQVEDALGMVLDHQHVGIGFRFEGDKHSCLVQLLVTKR